MNTKINVNHHQPPKTCGRFLGLVGGKDLVYRLHMVQTTRPHSQILTAPIFFRPKFFFFSNHNFLHQIFFPGQKFINLKKILRPRFLFRTQNTFRSTIFFQTLNYFPNLKYFSVSYFFSETIFFQTNIFFSLWPKIFLSQKLF